MTFTDILQEEWRKGLRAMRVDSLDKLKKTLPALQQEVHKPFRVNTQIYWRLYVTFAKFVRNVHVVILKEM